MQYAVLKELWPDMTFNNKFKKYVNTLPQNVVNNLIESAESRGGNKYQKNIRQKKEPQPIFYEKSRDYPLEEQHKEKQQKNIEKFENIYYGKYHSECSSILKHLSQCEKCRHFVQKKFTPKVQEVKRSEQEDEYLDLAIYIVTGIFVLFILDMLLKFGKKRNN